eukprot:359459-Chlamydomonas_euryale.AAC.4
MQQQQQQQHVSMLHQPLLQPTMHLHIQTDCGVWHCHLNTRTSRKSPPMETRRSERERSLTSSIALSLSHTAPIVRNPTQLGLTTSNLIESRPQQRKDRQGQASPPAEQQEPYAAIGSRKAYELSLHTRESTCGKMWKFPEARRNGNGP